MSESSRKISFEKSATKFELRLGAGTPEVVREAEAFVSNVPFSAETPSMEGYALIVAYHTLNTARAKC